MISLSFRLSGILTLLLALAQPILGAVNCGPWAMLIQEGGSEVIATSAQRLTQQEVIVVDSVGTETSRITVRWNRHLVETRTSPQMPGQPKRPDETIPPFDLAEICAGEIETVRIRAFEELRPEWRENETRHFASEVTQAATAETPSKTFYTVFTRHLKPVYTVTIENVTSPSPWLFQVEKNLVLLFPNGRIVMVDPTVPLEVLDTHLRDISITRGSPPESEFQIASVQVLKEPNTIRLKVQSGADASFYKVGIAPLRPTTPLPARVYVKLEK